MALRNSISSHFRFVVTHLKPIVPAMLASIATTWAIDYAYQQLTSSSPSIFVAVLIAAGIIAVTSTSARKIPRSSEGKPLPRPSSTLPILDNSIDLVCNIDRLHDWISETSRALGYKPWLLHALGQPKMVMISSPEAYQDVQRRLFGSFTKGGLVQDCMREFFGDAFIVVDGDKWSFQRKTSMSLFSTRALREHMASVINKHTITLDRVLEKTAIRGSELDLFKLMQQFTMEAFTEIAFGLQLGNIGSETSHEFEAAFDDAQHISMIRMQLPPLVWKIQRLLDIGKERRLKQSMEVVNGTIMGIIEQTIAKTGDGGSSRKDIVSMFIASDEGKERLTPALLRDIVLTLLVAGRDTSAEAMSWLIHCLSKRPDVEAKIREEIKATLGSDVDVNQQIPIEVLQKLTFLEAAIRETLRLYPPGSFNPRFASEDVTLSDGTFIPAGTYVVFTPFTTARRKDIWGDDAAEFKPERWLNPEDPTKLNTVSSFKFNTFLAGPRQCIGMNLAMLEMKTVMTKVLGKFHLYVLPGQLGTYRHAITLPIKGGLRVLVQPI